MHALEKEKSQGQSEIEDFYEMIGLGSSDARAQFASFADPEPKIIFDVVTSTHSNPF